MLGQTVCPRPHARLSKAVPYRLQAFLNSRPSSRSNVYFQINRRSGKSQPLFRLAAAPDNFNSRPPSPTSQSPPSSASARTGPKRQKLPPQCDFYAFAHILREEDAAAYVLQHQAGIVDLLTGGQYMGILVLYVAPGDAWKKMVTLVSRLGENGDGPGGDDDYHPGSLMEGRLVEKVSNHARKLDGLRAEMLEMRAACRKTMHDIEARCPQLADMHRVRIVSPVDFYYLMQSVRSRRALRADFDYWFQSTTYDTHKFIDAVLRIRTMGSKVPVLRFDQDVLFNSSTLQDGMARVKDMTLRAVECVSERKRDYRQQNWVSSGQYVHMGLPEVSAADRGDWRRWNEAFSTRMNPAQLATREMCCTAQFDDAKGWTPTEAEMQASLSEKVMMQFYGLEIDKASGSLMAAVPSLDEEDDVLRLGNTYIGANPMRAVVSGAALVTSTGLILDLPPFSHFEMNVMWIDDHCLDACAREVEGLKHNEAWLGSGNVVKARGPPSNCAWFTLEAYLPTLLYGCIMDAWILDEPCGYLLKYLPEDLPLRKLKMMQHKLKLKLMPDGTELPLGELSREIQTVLTRGAMLNKIEIKDFRARLWTGAAKRLQDVYWQWSHMPEVRQGDGETACTFASLWASGACSAHPLLGQYCDVPWAERPVKAGAERVLRLGAGMLDPLWVARAARCTSRSELPELRRGDLNPHLYTAVKTLMDNAVTHLEWVLAWPSVVQAVRSVDIGRIASDLAWVPGGAAAAALSGSGEALGGDYEFVVQPETSPFKETSTLNSVFD